MVMVVTAVIFLTSTGMTCPAATVKVAVAPLFLVWFGFGLLPKVLIAFLIGPALIRWLKVKQGKAIPKRFKTTKSL